VRLLLASGTDLDESVSFGRISEWWRCKSVERFFMVACITSI